MWEYLVYKHHLEEFKKTYGPGGEWVRLFRKADGYVTTHLHQDRSKPERFITVDFWKSKSDFDNFKKQFSREFEEIDRRCEQFTIEETLLGYFDFLSSEGFQAT